MMVLEDALKNEDMPKKKYKQAEAELGQAQLKLGLDINFRSELNLHWTNQLDLSLEIWLADS